MVVRPSLCPRQSLKPYSVPDPLTNRLVPARSVLMIMPVYEALHAAEQLANLTCPPLAPLITLFKRFATLMCCIGALVAQQVFRQWRPA
jgi:hypothetical protein